MSSRDFSTAIADAIVAGTVRPVFFVEGAFNDSGSPSETYLRLWSGLGDVTWDGKTWTGAGKLLTISPLEESAEIKAVGFSVELSGLPQDVLSLALANTRQGKAGRVWLGLMGRAGHGDLPGTTGNYFSTPHQAAFEFVNGFEVEALLTADDYTPAANDWIAGQDTATAATGSWRLILQSTGELLIQVSNGSGYIGATSSVALSAVATNGEDVYIKASLDFDNGSSQRVGKFWYKFDLADDWIQLGTTQTNAGAVVMNVTALPLTLGSNNNGTAGLFAGDIHYVKVRDDVDGTEVARFDPSVDGHKGDTSFTSSETGETWTINQSGTPHADIIVDDNHIIADPYLVRAGRMDYVSVAADGDTTRITAQYEDRLVDLERARERRYTDEDQQYEYPGDLGFEFVSALQDKQLIWGGPGAAASPLAVPTPPPENDTSNDAATDD